MNEIIYKCKKCKKKFSELNIITNNNGQRAINCPFCGSVNFKDIKLKRQFSKSHVIFANFIVFYAFTLSALICFINNQLISDVTIALITTYGAFATGGYFAQNVFRDRSNNDVTKHHIQYSNKDNNDDGENRGDYNC